MARPGSGVKTLKQKASDDFTLHCCCFITCHMTRICCCLNENKWASMRCHTVEMYASAAEVHFASLWPWPSTLKTFQQRPLTWWTFVPSFIEIIPLSTEISLHAKCVHGQRTENGHTDGWTTAKHNASGAYCWRRWHNYNFIVIMVPQWTFPGRLSSRPLFIDINTYMYKFA